MKLKQITSALTLMAAAFTASAMQPIADADLSNMTGQSGISIVTDLKLNIGEVSLSNADASSSIKMQNISATGLITTKVDIVSGAEFKTALGVAAAAGLPGIGYTDGTDVLQMSFPGMAATTPSSLLSVSVGSTQFGNGGSLGSMAINNINMGGTRVWIFAN